MGDARLAPNSGAAVPDTTAAGDDQETQASWLHAQNIDTNGRIQLNKVSHVRYQHPDLDEIHKFLTGKLARLLSPCCQMDTCTYTH